jgi:hypothetical protein
MESKDKVFLWQIQNLRKRLALTRGMQIMGISSLLLCVATMFLLYVGAIAFAEVIFGVALLMLIVSLGLLIWEIQISTKALDIQVGDMEG